MEHSIRPVELPHRWRTATLVACAAAAFELVLLIILAVALFGDSVSRSMRATAAEVEAASMRPPAPKPANDGVPRLDRAETSVLVLNGNGRTGAAGAAADRLRARGYMIGGVGNAPRSDHTRSVVMYRKGYRAEALRLGRDLGVRIVGPLDGLPLSSLMGAHTVLVVGSG